MKSVAKTALGVAAGLMIFSIAFMVAIGAVLMFMKNQEHKANAGVYDAPKPTAPREYIFAPGLEHGEKKR